MVTDRMNKKNDLCGQVRDIALTLEQKVLGIQAISLMSYEQIKTNWNALPNKYKTHNINLGCS